MIYRLIKSENFSIAKVFVVSLLSIFACVLITNPASAASYLNVSSSSSGSISFGKVRPTSSGTSASASDTLTVNTNCSAGYSVYVSGQSGKSTSLVNTNTNVTTNNTIPTSSAAVGSATTLTNNTWGISPADNGTYFGLPAYADATNTAFTTKSSVGEQSTVPVYYGAKVTTSITPGTYTGDILYTVLPSSACTVYTVHFNANGGSGTMNDQVINVGAATALSANTFTRSNYVFLGWSNSASGKTGTATNGIGTMADVDYTNEQSVTDIADFNTTKNLYAIWAPTTNMQGWTGCNSLATNAYAYLKDTRDGKIYPVKKLADGRCWMTENLTITNVNMTSSDTNLASGTTFNLTSSNITYSGSSGWCQESSSACDNTKAVYISSDASTNITTGPNTGTKISTSDKIKSGYYNWYTATAGNGTYSTGAETTVNYDICPRGWRLPVGGSSTSQNQFAALDIALNTQDTLAGVNRYNGYSGVDQTALQASFNNLRSIFPLAGSIYGALQGNNVFGAFWSATSAGNTIYYLRLHSADNTVYPRNNDAYKFYGMPIHCVAQKNYTISYSANSGSGSASKTSETAFESGTITMPTQGTLTKERYDFKGWALTSSATTAKYNAGASVSISTLISDAAAAGQTVTSGSTITLYAVWERIIVYMQANTPCKTIDPGTTGILRDARDNQDYTVYHFTTSDAPTGMSGYCMMTKDLSLGYTTGGSVVKGQDLTLTTDNSAATATILARTSSSDWSTTNSDANLQYVNGPKAGYESISSYTYYTYAAAKAVCPKGWSLPTDAQWKNVATFMGGNNATGATKAMGEPYNFTLGGYFVSSGLGDVNSRGNWWSSVQSSASMAYNLGMGASALSVGTASYKYNGMAVRCITEPVDGTMQEFDVSSFSTTVGTTTFLRDTRDGRAYAVKRLPDGKVWMMQNLTIGSDGAKTLTSADTNIDDGKTYYLPPPGKQGSSTIDQSSTLTATTTANFGTSNDNRAKTQFRTKGTYTNDSNTGYYNFYTATLGYSYYNDGKTSGTSTRDICPKGWRLPKTTNNGNSVSSGSSAEFTSLVNTYLSSPISGTGNISTSDTTAKNSMFASAAYPISTNTQNNYAGFSYSGRYSGTSSGNVGSAGGCWSASVYGTNYSYGLNFNPTISPQYNYSKVNGYAVRCIAKESSGTPGCFTAGTKVQTTMAGETKAIEDIKIGDRVVSYDPENQKYYLTEVLDTVIHDGDERFTKLARLSLENGATLEMTMNHPILTTDGYKALQNQDYPVLTKDDTTITTTGAYKISGIDIYDTEPTVVYNLTVRGREGDTADGPTHSYIANGVIVHNAATGG